LLRLPGSGGLSIGQRAGIGLKTRESRAGGKESAAEWVGVGGKGAHRRQFSGGRLREKNVSYSPYKLAALNKCFRYDHESKYLFDTILSAKYPSR
jgi:hypothetical protein